MLFILPNNSILHLSVIVKANFTLLCNFGRLNKNIITLLCNLIGDEQNVL